MRFQPFLCFAFSVLSLSMVVSGCAPAIPVTDAHLITLTPSQQAATLTVQEDVAIHLSSGYERTIRAQSHWRVAGSLPQGQVLRPVGFVFTIEGRQVHEAYLVVADRRLVGFYLPGEAHFSPLDKPISLMFGDL